jgi:hypothetical protein
MLSILELIGGACDALNALDAIAAAFAGWRYLFSPSYRARTHSRWQQTTQLRITVEIIGSLICMAASIFLLALLVCYLFGLGWFSSAPHLH